MSLGTIILIILVIVLMGGFHPSLAYSYSPYGGIGLGTLLVIVLVLVLLGRI